MESDSNTGRSTRRRVIVLLASLLVPALLLVGLTYGRIVRCPEGYSGLGNMLCGARCPDTDAAPVPEGWAVVASANSGGSGGCFARAVGLDAPASVSSAAVTYDEHLSVWRASTASDGLEAEVEDIDLEAIGWYLEQEVNRTADVDVWVVVNYVDYGECWGEWTIPCLLDLS